jgi:hypothetical protein
MRLRPLNLRSGAWDPIASAQPTSALAIYALLKQPLSAGLVGIGDAGTLFVHRLDHAVVSRGASIADALCTEGVFTARRCVAIDFGGIGFGGRIFADIPICLFLGCVHDARFSLLKGRMQEIGGGMGDPTEQQSDLQGLLKRSEPGSKVLVLQAI